MGLTSVQFAKDRGYSYPKFEDESTARTSQVQTEMNVGWMRENPELAVKAIVEFFNSHPEDQFDYSIQPRFIAPNPRAINATEVEANHMHVGYIELTAKRLAE